MHNKLAIITEESPTLLSAKETIACIDLFGGSFQEIKYFVQSLQKIINIDLFVISSKYGLIKGNERIKPYNALHATEVDPLSIETELRVFNNFFRIINNNNYTFLLFVISKKYLNFIFHPNYAMNFTEKLTKNQILIVVCAKSLFNRLQKIANNKGIKIFLLCRKGVARIGKENRQEILNIVNDYK